MTSFRLHLFIDALLILLPLGSVGLAADPPYYSRYRDYSYAAAGISRIAIDSAATAIDGRSADGGLLLIYGQSFYETWFLEIGLNALLDFTAGETLDIYYPPDRVEYGSFFLGGRKSLWPVDERGWSPWLTVGFGWSSIVWDTFFYDLSGGSYYYGGGVDVVLARNLLLRLQVDNNHFSASDGYNHPSYSTDVLQSAGVLVLRW